MSDLDQVEFMQEILRNKQHVTYPDGLSKKIDDFNKNPFTAEQVSALINEYNRKKYPSQLEIKEISKYLGLHEKRVNEWFKYRRRKKNVSQAASFENFSRKRLYFTHEQYEKLNEEFSQNKRPTKEEVEKLAGLFGVNPFRIRKWFEHKRQKLVKNKKLTSKTDTSLSLNQDHQSIQLINKPPCQKNIQLVRASDLDNIGPCSQTKALASDWSQTSQKNIELIEISDSQTQPNYETTSQKNIEIIEISDSDDSDFLDQLREPGMRPENQQLNWLQDPSYYQPSISCQEQQPVSTQQYEQCNSQDVNYCRSEQEQCNNQAVNHYWSEQQQQQQQPYNYNYPLENYQQPTNHDRSECKPQPLGYDWSEI